MARNIIGAWTVAANAGCHAALSLSDGELAPVAMALRCLSLVQTPADLKQRLGVFYKNLPAREYKFLISEPDFNFNTLKKLLVNNELRDFDPVKEAFKVRTSACMFLL